MPMSCASWKSLLLMKFLPSVAETLLITDVVSRSGTWNLGSGRSPMNRRMVTQRASAAWEGAQIYRDKTYRGFVGNFKVGEFILDQL